MAIEKMACMGMPAWKKNNDGKQISAKVSTFIIEIILWLMRVILTINTLAIFNIFKSNIDT